MPTKEECQRQLFQIGIKIGVSPKLISTRLLSKQDKEDMLAGLIPPESLMAAVKIWVQNKMPDYANGHTEPYRREAELPMSRYRGIGDR